MRSRRRKCEQPPDLASFGCPGSARTSGGSARAALAPRRRSGAIRRDARSADGRHRCRAARRAAHAPPARTAGWPARIDIGAHGVGAPRPPGPYRRRDIIDDRDRRRAGAHAARDAVGEIRAVDDDQRIRARGDDGVGGLANAAKIIGSRRGMALKPMIARSSIGNGLAIPAAAIARPPTPTRLSAPASRAGARATSAAPSASPDSSAGDDVNRQRSRLRRVASSGACPRARRRKKSLRGRRPR